MAKANKEDKKLLERIRKRYTAMVEADRENRLRAISDLKFCNVKGEQWDQEQKKARGELRCLELNKVRPTVKRVVNEMRKNRPQGKVRGWEDGDKDTAEIIEGQARNIWNVSDGDTVIDYAGEYQVGGGMGAWRVNTRYSTDDAFDQDIIIEAIRNPFCLYPDNACADILKRDARDWVLTEKITKSAYESKYKGFDVVEFDSDTEFDDDDDWKDDETVRICEYWYKDPATKTICLLSTGESVDKAETPVLPEGATILKERVVQTHKIMMCTASGNSILEGPVEWAGTMFPFVMIYGDWLVIDGKIHWSGITRHARDAQVIYNTANVAAVEFAALQPKAKYWATSKQALGNTEQWAEANQKNLPALIYTPDAIAPGPPVMMSPPPVPQAFVEMIMRASEDIKAVTGIYDASLGAQGNETSGRAINARQAQGEVATFNFNDNMGKGIRRTYEILIDLIPKVYDTERSIRILGVDGAEKYVKVNQIVVDPATGERKVINDLSRGKFDVTVTIGPSYATQRQEAATVFTEIASRDPNFMPVAGDLMFKSMDIPLADQIGDRYRMALLPQVQKQLSQDKPLPPEVQVAMEQVDQAMQQVQQHGQLVQAAQQELEQSKAEITKQEASLKGAAADIEVKSANLRAEYESLVADIVKRTADLRILGSQIQLDAQQVKHESDAQQVRKESDDAVLAVRHEADEFIRKVYEAVSQP